MDDSIICLNKLVNLVIFHSNVELPEGICNKVSITIRMVGFGTLSFQPMQASTAQARYLADAKTGNVTNPKPMPGKNNTDSTVRSNARRQTIGMDSLF